MLLRRLLALLRIALYGWVLALIELLRRVFCRRPDHSMSERDRRASRSPCVAIDNPAFVRADPLIYSQKKMRSLGLAVTWNNPDIVLFRDGTAVPSHALVASTTYEVRVRVWNNSIDAPVISMPVHLSFRDAGIGTAPTAVGSATVDVGVKGSTTQPGFCTIPWTTPPTAGHFCLRATLDPVADADGTNNTGDENTRVGVARSPATLEFQLRNDDRVHHTYRFEFDAYELGHRPPCDKEGGHKQRAERIKQHTYGTHPMPEGWTVSVAPEHPTLAPGEQIEITVTIEPPPGFVGTQTVNVNAFHEDDLAGGMTFTVQA